ncbi:hypothetical protein MtrunA17_Chr8g0379861 [Medicago truncatula]|uniref:Uncharacterized protein n=1 Tax=Medicago truncatula TaxID=3880 RepID=A0A396GNN0_MEDTR|nr:hypothetical protein MtrunA17_Chr8g0379861 [Medicago truncatula]
MDYSANCGIGSGGVRRGWDAKEIEDFLLLRLDMPGLGFMVDVGFYCSSVSLFSINQRLQICVKAYICKSCSEVLSLPK